MKKLWLQLLAIIVVLWLVVSANFAFGSDSMSKQKIVELSGAQLRALTTAYADFDVRGLDAARYTVRIVQEKQGFLVVFQPEHPPGPTTRGGRTIHGPELHYQMSQTGQMESVTYAR